MAVTNDWGEASVNNTNGYGKGAINNTIRWGKIYESSASGDTNIGTAVTPSFTNTLSTRFDGVDDFVNCGTNSSLNFERTDAFSYSFWVARASFNTNHMMLSKMNPSGNRRGMFLNLNSENKVVVMLRTDTSFTSQRLFWKTNELINDSNWHHIVFTFDGSSTVGGGKIYIDGAAATFDMANGALSATIQQSSPFLIGTMSTAPLLPADAALDEVAVFNTELSASAVTTIYNSGVPNDLTGTSGLVSWWRMGDGDTFPTITDNVGSNNGTMTNMSAGNFISNVPT